MQKYFLTLLLLSSIVNAYTICDDLDIAVQEGFEVETAKQLLQEARRNDLYAECLEATGSSDIFFYSGEWVNTCEGQSGSKNGYVKSEVRCDFCDGANIKLQLEIDESICNAKCKKKNTACMRINGGWGGEIRLINPNGGDCGAFDPTLPGCSESSSSEFEQSSSSEPQSSSSLESSSSIESSSSEEISESSSSEETDSSSSEENEDSSSSDGSCGEGGDHCGGSSGSWSGPTGYCEIGGENREALSRLKDVHVDVYNSLPYMLNREDIYLVNCYCMSSRFVACDFQNFGLAQGYTPAEMPMCGYQEGYWCNGIENGVCDFRGRTTRLYYTDQPNIYNSWWADAFWEENRHLAIENGSMMVILTETASDGSVSQSNLFSMRHLLPANVIYQDLEDIVLGALPAFPDMGKLIAYCHNEWVPHDEDCVGTIDEVNEALQDSSDNCSITYGIPHYEIEYSNRGWCVVGECQAAEPYSSAEEYSSSFEESSSSVELSSSYESSSSQEVSSSSEEISEPFIAGADQEYSPDQIFDSGLQNMEENTCYSLNPDRGSQYGWINTNAQDPYWWIKTPCDGSSIVVESTSNGCVENKRGVDAVYLPGDCFNSGLDNMEKGKCYSTNPDRGVLHGWINNNAQDSYWWIETPCEIDNGNESGSEQFVCPEENVLFKKSAEYASSDSYDEYVGLTALPNYYYDALGRKMNYQKAFHVKQRLYVKNLVEKEYPQNRAGNIRYRALLKMVSGHVEADTELGFDNIFYNCSSTGTIISVDLYMRTPKESIVMKLESSNQTLIDHEMRHKEIYEKYGTKNWFGKKLTLKKSIKESEICETVKRSFWPVVQKEYRKLLERQNAWDDEDKNNVSHERINVESAIAEQKAIWFSQQCTK